MSENLEAELWVLIKDLKAARLVVAAVFTDEIWVLEQLLEIEAHFFTRITSYNVCYTKLLRPSLSSKLPTVPDKLARW